MQEIERKFLVASDAFRAEKFRSTVIKQGYLNSDPARTVRVRIAGEKGYLTIKGKSSADGLSRFEWENEIPLDEAEDLMALGEPGIIAKVRHHVINGNHLFEVDEFLEENQGLIMAEIELGSHAEAFPRPNWLGDEVTGDRRYYNAFLSKHPFSSWHS